MAPAGPEGRAAPEGGAWPGLAVSAGKRGSLSSSGRPPEVVRTAEEGPRARRGAGAGANTSGWAPPPPPVGTRVSLLPPCVCRGKAWLQPAGRLSSPHAGCPSFALQAGPPPRGPFRGERCFPSAPSRLSSHPDPPGSARPRGRVSFFSRYCGERRVAGKTPLHPRQILLQGDAGYRRGLAGVCCWKARAGGAV